MYALETTLHRLSVRRFHAEFYIRPDRRAAACALGKSPRDDPGFYFAQYHRFADLPCGRRSLTVFRRRALFADKNQNAGHERQDSHHDCWDGNVEEHGDSNKDEIDREQEHSEVFGDIHASFLRQTRRLCTLKDIPHDQIVMVNCQFGRRGRIGCQAASLPPDPRSPGWQPGGRVSQAGRHPIAPLSVKLTIDEHYRMITGLKPASRTQMGSHQKRNTKVSSPAVYRTD